MVLVSKLTNHNLTKWTLTVTGFYSSLGITRVLQPSKYSNLFPITKYSYANAQGKNNNETHGPSSSLSEGYSNVVAQIVKTMIN